MPDGSAYCQDLVRDADKDRFLATLFAPAARRPHLYALYAFNIEIARVRERAAEPLAGEVRLQWWRDVIEGARPQEAIAHPVAAALLATMTGFDLSRGALLDLIEARTFDLYDDPMPTLADLEIYARSTSSTLIELAIRILGGDPPLDIAGPAGIAYAITGLLRSLALHASRRQLFVPMEALQRHGARVEDVLAGRSSAELRAALAELRGRARHQLGVLAAGIAAVPNDIFPALLPLAVVPGYLDRMERRDYDPFVTTVDVPQWRRQWVLWRSARRRRIGSVRT
jgi:15-cis-phytoene synthase